ncbi:MAG TPA: serine hydrolase [Terriglobales bacterium]|nr:serine hydrolase [Terriglobales bacterium]
MPAMKMLRVLGSLFLLTMTAAAQAAPTAAHAELGGLWKAKRITDVTHARLLITRTGASYRADMLGYDLAVRAENGELRFALPNGQGFRGRLEKDGSILGHWSRGNAAFPVTLASDRVGRWSGTVTTSPDEFTLFLLLKPEGANSWVAVLRNPERDMGSLWGVTRLVREGSELRLMGKDRGKEVVTAKGAYDAEREQVTLVFDRGSFDFSREGDSSEFYPRGKSPARYEYHAPPALADGWPVATLASENIDQPALERLMQKLVEMPMDSLDAPQYEALLIARHGKLVFEEYFHGAHRDRLHNIRSAGKSVVSVLVGAVMQNGAPLRLDSPVYQVMNGGAFPPNLDPQKRTMTLEHLLTMSSGHFCDDSNDAAPGQEDKVWDNADKDPDFWKFTLELPLATPPGEKSVYCSMQPNLALGMVQHATGEFPLNSFDRLVAKPMRIGNYAWALDAAGNPYGGGGLGLAPRDFLKFGQLMLNDGAWNGRQILSRQFARASITPQYNLRRIGYGYLWWTEDMPYQGRKVRAFLALGNGGNNIVGVPELGLVVAIYGANYASRTTGRLREIVPRNILPAVREPGDDRNAPVSEQEYTNPYGRSDDGSRIRPKK